MGGTAVTAIVRKNFKKSGVASAILREIATVMERLLATGEPGIIDLRSLPMTDPDKFELAGTLGDGEVPALVNAGGASTVFETGFAGIWLVRHEDAGGRLAAEQIVVARAPEFLLSHPVGMATARTRLNALLNRYEIGLSEEVTNG